MLSRSSILAKENLATTNATDGVPSVKTTSEETTALIATIGKLRI